jgi:hypothetical protein
MQQVISDGFGLPLREVLYPSFPGYFFAVLNTRDLSILARAGVPPERARLLINPAFNPMMKTSKTIRETSLRKKLGLDNALPLYLYPVRAIRRKNIGEFLLLAALFRDRGNWIITQPPKNPVEFENYRFWKETARELKLPVCFEAGNRVDFRSLVLLSDRIITTSISEGFGMTFLEPWLYGKQLVGRDLPDITRDFKRVGLVYNRLYKKMLIPGKWISGLKKLAGEYHTYLGAAYRDFGLPVPENLKQQIDKFIFSRDVLDFALLDNKRQRQVIMESMEQSNRRETIIKMNKLKKMFRLPSSEVLNQNAGIIRKHMNLRQYGRALSTIYKDMQKQNKQSMTGSMRRLRKIHNPVAKEFLHPRYGFLLNR